jgi:hypothetical protein
MYQCWGWLTPCMHASDAWGGMRGRMGAGGRLRRWPKQSPDIADLQIPMRYVTCLRYMPQGSGHSSTGPCILRSDQARCHEVGMVRDLEYRLFMHRANDRRRRRSCRTRQCPSTSASSSPVIVDDLFF